MSSHLLLRALPWLTTGVVVLTACSSAATSTARTTAGPAPTTAPPASPAGASPAATTAAPTAPTAPAAGATITIRDFSYAVPASVGAGVQVQVVNDDAEAHTLTLRGGPSVVVPPRGAMVIFRAPTRTGTYEIVCDFHANMHAQLVVT